MAGTYWNATGRTHRDSAATSPPSCGSSGASRAPVPGQSRSASPAPAGARSSPGLVQNCPMPSVNEPTNPAAISAGRSAAAAGVTTTVFTVPISA